MDVVETLGFRDPAAGADEIMLQWFGGDDIEGLELLAVYTRAQALRAPALA